MGRRRGTALGGVGGVWNEAGVWILQSTGMLLLAGRRRCVGGALARGSWVYSCCSLQACFKEAVALEALTHTTGMLL